MRVVLLLLDAFDPGRLSPRLTPHLWALANREGAVAGRGRAVMAASTYPNHATFVTGVGPEIHGISTNHVVSEGVKGAWEVGPRAPTLFEGGWETAAVLGDHHLVGVMRAERATRHWPPGGVLDPSVRLDLLGYPDDTEVTPRLVAELGTAAELVVGYFGSVDTWSHFYGPASPEATEAYRRLDEQLGVVAAALVPGWSETVLVVLSDHIQETATGPGIDLRPHLPEAVTVVDEGGAALVAGSVEPGRLRTIGGVAGWAPAGAGSLLVWAEPGRYFGPFSEPLLRGVHGGPGTRTQLAIVGGGHRRRSELAAAVAASEVPAIYWAGAIRRLLG
jgi:hypothetical protein